MKPSAVSSTAKHKTTDHLSCLIKNGVLFENPVFCLALGMCPILAVTTSVSNAFYMSLAVLFVLTMSSTLISLLRKIIPSSVRIPAFIVIIAGFVSIVQMLVSAYFPFLNDALGIYIPLIVVNCIVLARAEAFASKNPLFPSILDAFSMGLGFSLALFLISTVREVIGYGSFFDIEIRFLTRYVEPINFFVTPAGGFFTFGICIMFFHMFVKKIRRKRPPHQGKAAAEGCDICGACTAGKTGKEAL